MKQAHTVKDTLDVSRKLSDVRNRIERLQAQIKVMTHDIETVGSREGALSGIRHARIPAPVATPYTAPRSHCAIY